MGASRTYNPRMTTDTSDILNAAWKGYAERFPACFDAPHPDLRFSCAGISVALFNCAYPKRAIKCEEFERLMNDFAGILAPRGVPGLLMARSDRVEAPPGLEPVIRMPGMVANGLFAPKYPVANVDMREVRGEKMAEEIARLNVVCHGMPEEEIGPMTSAALWEPPNHGFLIYADGEAVSAGSASYVNGASYIGWMATLEKFRGRGYAETILRHMDAVMRREYGVRESVLHATELGRPVYERVGYRTVDEFMGYLCMPAAGSG
jgi:ribosomal protein S18 acetylase RimI-like enzyme